MLADSIKENIIINDHHIVQRKTIKEIISNRKEKYCEMSFNIISQTKCFFFQTFVKNNISNVL